MSKLWMLMAAGIIFAGGTLVILGNGNAVTLSCMDDTTACQRVVLNQTPVTCNEWYPGDGRDSLNCNYTTAGLERVTLVTDPANHIRAPISTAPLTTEYSHPDTESQWDLEPLPGGAWLITQQDGTIKRYRDGHTIKLGNLSVLHRKMAGLMGAAVDPRFEENRFIYLYYTYAFNDSAVAAHRRGREQFYVHSRISRFRLVESSLKDENVLLNAIPGTVIHAGGRLEIGPDHKLYATTGDVQANLTGLFASMAGSILRLHRNGTIPADNPVETSPVYSRGHRNPQGLAWAPQTGTLYASEHGPWRYDEINRIMAGADYGWVMKQCSTVRPALRPCLTKDAATMRVANGTHISCDVIRSHVKGPGRQINETRDPAACITNWTLAPSGMTFVEDPGHPWHGDLFVAALRGKHLHRFQFENGRIVKGDIFWVNQAGPSVNGMSRRLRDVEYRNGSLYVLGDHAGIARISPD